MDTTSKTSSQEFNELLQQVHSLQALKFIAWILRRVTGKNARAWMALLKKLFRAA